VPDGFALDHELVTRIGMRTVPQDRDLVRTSLGELRDGAVAVRSSAVGEDSAGASFAGQHLTRLNVRGGEEVANAISEVWASGRTDAAMAYRRRMGVSEEPRIAAVVQEFVPADVAGVMFTADPVSGSRSSIVVEAAGGLGEAVVSGMVTPDHFVLSRSGGVLSQQIASKDVAVVAHERGGTREQPVEGDAAGVGCLLPGDLLRLAQLAEACERVFGPGQDIEWAFAGGELFLLQCRPITTS